MCGIAGAVNWGDRSTLLRMTEIQAHRGPDDSGLFEATPPEGDRIGLGSRRLAILDLSPLGRMPMGTPDGKIWITYNGEIYNFRGLRKQLESKGYRFRTQTDTEVLLRLYEEYGTDCLRHLNGMFAFAILDLREGGESSWKILLARDHFGIKPLYFVRRGHRFGFASEAKALLQLPGLKPEIDLSALHQYLTFLWVPEPRTMFQGIRKLPAAHYAVLSRGDFQIHRYWSPPFPGRTNRYSRKREDLVVEIRDRFLETVRAQMVSDVPVGAFLSSGIDSSGIVAMMARAGSSRLRTYTVRFPPHYLRGEISFDNPEVARETARTFHAEHHELTVEPDVAALLPKLIWHMDDPVADPAIILAYLVSREARGSSTVLLSGIGGDELFGGYRKYKAQYWSVFLRRFPGQSALQRLRPLADRLPSFRGTPVKGWVRLLKKMTRSAALPRIDSFLSMSTYLDEEQKQKLYTVDVLEQLRNENPFAAHREAFEEASGIDPLHQLLYVDMKTFMVSLNLGYNDRMSMATSIETRVPYLDREFAEFVCREVPAHLKMGGMPGSPGKRILRQSLRGILPETVFSQSKAGFGAPIDYWLSRDLAEMSADLLSPARIHARGLFDPRRVEQLMSEHRRGREDWSFQIWQLLTLELWLDAFFAK